jgi:hypothetical protein
MAATAVDQEHRVTPRVEVEMLACPLVGLGLVRRKLVGREVDLGWSRAGKDRRRGRLGTVTGALAEAAERQAEQ